MVFEISRSEYPCLATLVESDYRGPALLDEITSSGRSHLGEDDLNLALILRLLQNLGVIERQSNGAYHTDYEAIYLAPR